MAPNEIDGAAVDAFMAKIDAHLAARNATVESWGYKVHVPSAAEIEAEIKEVSRKEPPGLGLGYPVPQDWIDGEEERNAAEERKWRAGSLRKNMGLQASKPRNPADKRIDNFAGNGAESTDDDEEGRSGLGKAKRAKAASKIKVDVGESLEKKAESTPVAQQKELEETFAPMPNIQLGERMNHIRAWSEDASQSLTTPPDPDVIAPSYESLEQDFIESDKSIDSTKITSSQEAELRDSVHDLFGMPQDSKKRKHKDSIDITTEGEHATENPAKILKTTEASAAKPKKNKRVRARRSSGSEQVRQSKAQVSGGPISSSINKEPNNDQRIITNSPTQAEIEAKAKARALAREMLGSGLTTKKSKKTKGSHSAFATKVKKS